jgi:hypothetical protein
MARNFVTALIALSLAGCSANFGNDDGTDTNNGSSDFALVSSTGEQGVLRTGDSLALRISDVAGLASNATYRYDVVGGGGAVLADGDLRTDRDGQVYLATVLHDAGEDGRVAEGDNLIVSLRDAADFVVARTAVSMGSLPLIQRPGFNVDEVDPPHIFAATATGQPQNAFAVGGAEPGEPLGPVYAAGEGFPEAVIDRDIDLYVVRDRDEWRGRPIPHEGDAEWIAGPIAAHVNALGVLEPVAIFTPGLGHVGIYDIVADVDRDGVFEWSFDSKDGADGLGRVGFTIQYSQAWLAARESQHILVNIAFDSHTRDGGSWANEYRSDQPLFMSLNPPVVHQYHFHVTKWVVRHQDFEAFWNNPAMADEEGDVHFAQFAVMSGLEDTPQGGCTNAMVCWGEVPTDAGVTEQAFDIVYDRNGDGQYQIGEDLLDVVGGDTTGDIISVEQLRAMNIRDQVGFRVIVQ